MAVMAREARTDERLDDLRGDMNKSFARVDSDIREIRAEMRQMRAEMKEGFDRMDARFDTLQRTMIISLAGIAGSIAASVIGGIVVTQL
ncbi:MAG TPA: hypothetical protein VN733_06455 [Solirubrobacterales bacterium]|nr:hypothetical protein [Solirubrobacterales bacterium]